jgi:hypothetical protein
MTYGLEKIIAPKMVDSILEVIKDELMRQDAFSNTSMAYYGIELSFKIDMRLHARKETHVVVEAESGIGAKTEKEPEKISIKGKRVAGKKIVVNPGEHTRDRAGVDV